MIVSIKYIPDLKTFKTRGNSLTFPERQNANEKSAFPVFLAE